MPSFSRNMVQKWVNYHLTVQGRYVPQSATGFDPDLTGKLDSAQCGYPNGSVREVATLHCSDLGSRDGPEMLAVTGSTLQHLLSLVVDPSQETKVVPFRPAADCVAIGRGWSFSRLVGARDYLIDTAGWSGMRLVHPQDLAASPADPANRKLALVLGGTRLRELTAWAQREHGLSIETSGTHLGLSVAGSVATASHGSRLGFGGIQNMVRGLHIVTGPTSSAWIERASDPVLRQQAAEQFATEIIRDDALFEDVLVHLGGMGLVNALALQLVDDDPYDVGIAVETVGEADLATLAAGDFDAVAQKFAGRSDPVFYELTIDPFDWAGNEAVHTFYFRSGQAKAFDPQIEPLQRTFADASGMIAATMLREKLSPAAGFPSVFERYREAVKALPQPQGVRWNQLHGDEITGGFPGALYNASFAIDRTYLPQVIPLMCQAVAGQLPTFLFTVRFVSEPAGTLAFTRFRHNAVIEIDGFSDKAPGELGQFGQSIVVATSQIRAALEALEQNDPAFGFGMHWGKLGDLDRAKVEHDFDRPDAGGSTPLGRWKAARARLLGKDIRKILWNEALDDWGMAGPSSGPQDGGN